MNRIFALIMSLAVMLSVLSGVAPHEVNAEEGIYIESSSLSQQDLQHQVELIGTKYTSDFASPWSALVSNYLGKPVSQSFIDAALLQVENKKGIYTKGTDVAGVVIGLTSANYDITDVSGYNFIEKMSNFDISKLTISNDLVYMLLSLDSGMYEPLEDATITRQILVNKLLDLYLPEGGWSFTGPVPDPDMTGIILTALSPYKSELSVSKAVYGAVENLKGEQLDNSNSLAMMILGLSSVGIDPTGDNYKQGEVNAVEELLSYKLPDNTFKWMKTDAAGSGFSTKDSLFALMGYNNYLKGSNHIFHGIGNKVTPPVTPPVAPPVAPPVTPPSDTVKVSINVTSNISHTGIPFSGNAVINKGDSVLDALLKLTSNVDYIGSGVTSYVQGIKGLQEFAHGPLSGWNYSVNGTTPGVGSGSYVLKDGDSVIWSYQGEPTVVGGGTMGGGKPSLPSDSDTGTVDTGKGTGTTDTGKGTDTGNGLTPALIAESLAKFSDRDKVSDWAKEGIARAERVGIVTGSIIEGKRFISPKDNISRAEFLKILITLKFGKDIEQGEKNFKDVPENAWYSKYVNKAVKERIVVGLSPDKFGPEGHITREQMAIMISRAFGSSQDPIKYVQDESIMIGDKVGFSPKDKATREMAIVISVRLYDKIKK